MLAGASQLLAYFRGEQPYWRAYSLFAVHLALVLVAAWCVIEWSVGPGATALRLVSLLLLTLAPSLWIIWVSARNIATPGARGLARVGVLAAAVSIVIFLGFAWQ